MNARTATQIPAPFRKAARVADEIALRAGELHNSLTDGQRVTVLDLRELSALIVTVNTKRKSIVDASTGALFFKAAHHIGKAVDASFDEDTETMAEHLELAADAMDEVKPHVEELFGR